MVLCGGQSRRMGRSKALLPFGTETLLERVTRIVGSATDPVIVVAAAGQMLPPLPPQVHVVHDEQPSLGPLQGLASGLRTLQQMGIEAVFASATDTPFLKKPFIERVGALLGDSHVAVPFVNGRYHPMAAAYRTNCLPVIDALIAEGRLRVTSLFDQVPTRVIQAAELASADELLESLVGLNHPADYERAIRVGHGIEVSESSFGRVAPVDERLSGRR